jgi:hypothetical protein
MDYNITTSKKGRPSKNKSSLKKKKSSLKKKKSSKKQSVKKQSIKKQSVKKQSVKQSNNTLNVNEHLLLSKVKKYYDAHDNISELIPILNGTSSISLRIIDWFVTNYSKKNNIYYKLTNGNHFTVYQSYKSQLKSFSKKRFDPFCRRERISYIHKDLILNTTVGQLNFFKWALENNIINYIKKNLKAIEIDMYVSCKNNKAKNTSGERKKRQELSVSATRTISKKNIKICVSFD